MVPEDIDETGTTAAGCTTPGAGLCRPAGATSHRRPLVRRWPPEAVVEQLEGALDPDDVVGPDLCVSRRGAQSPVAEQRLDHAEVDTRLEQVRGKGVAK